MSLLPSIPGSEQLTPAARFEGDRLLFSRQLTVDETQHLLALLRSCNDHSIWWSVDLLSHIKKHRGEEAAKEAADNFSCPPELLEAVKVDEGLAGQRLKLSYAHHRQALVECAGDGKEALKWLKRAEEGSWTPSQLRASIRKALSDSGSGIRGAKGSVTITTDLRRFQDRLKKILDERPVESWTAAELEAFSEDAGFLLDFAFEIKLRVGGLPQKLHERRGDKDGVS